MTAPASETKDPRTIGERIEFHYRAMSRQGTGVLASIVNAHVSRELVAAEVRASRGRDETIAQLRAQLTAALTKVSDPTAKCGELEGVLAASEMASTVRGWRERATAAAAKVAAMQRFADGLRREGFGATADKIESALANQEKPNA